MCWPHGSNSGPWVSVAPVEGPSLDGRSRLELPTGSTRFVGSLSMSGDERYLAASDTSGWVALWDMHAPSPEESRRRFRPNLQTGRDAQFFPSGDRLVTGGRSHDLMKIWDRESLQQLLAFDGEGVANEVIVSPDESIIGARVDYRDASRIELWRAPSYEELAEAISSVEEIPVRSIESLELADRFSEAVSTGLFEQVEKEWGAILALDPWPKELQADRLVDTYVGGVVAEAERLHAAGETTRAIALLRTAALIDLGRSGPGEAGIAISRLVTLIGWEFPNSPVLVSKGASWKYLDDGSDQGTAWRNPEFDDRGWKEGSAKLGYGDEVTTEIDSGPDESKYLTSYFRHQFSLQEGQNVGFLKLDLLLDDGAVLYLNGKEIVRSNMPAGPVTSQTEAGPAVAGSAESNYDPYLISADQLSPGSNVLAVEVHQSNARSSDLGFDLKLSLLPHSPARHLAQMLEDAGSDSLAERGRDLLPGPLREQWMRDFKFVIVGETDGEVSDIPDHLWVRRFELREGAKAQLETAERRLKILEADVAANANLIEDWKSRMEQAQAGME